MAVNCTPGRSSAPGRWAMLGALDAHRQAGAVPRGGRRRGGAWRAARHPPGAHLPGHRPAGPLGRFRGDAARPDRGRDRSPGRRPRVDSDPRSREPHAVDPRRQGGRSRGRRHHPHPARRRHRRQRGADRRPAGGPGHPRAAALAGDRGPRSARGLRGLLRPVRAAGDPRPGAGSDELQSQARPAAVRSRRPRVRAADRQPGGGGPLLRAAASGVPAQAGDGRRPAQRALDPGALPPVARAAARRLRGRGAVAGLQPGRRRLLRLPAARRPTASRSPWATPPGTAWAPRCSPPTPGRRCAPSCAAASRSRSAWASSTTCSTTTAPRRCT